MEEGKKRQRSRVKVVGKYAIGKTLGEGSYGKVKLCKNLETGVKCAVKIIRKSRVDRGTIKRINREIQILKSLDHPNIVRLFDVLSTSKSIYIVMEYCSGGELFDYIIDNKRVSEDESRGLFAQIVRGVYYCHQRHICHRDLKPENILRDQDGNLKIIDFGLSNLCTPGQMMDSNCGSPQYTAPEVAANQNYNTAVDIWSMGVILFALLTGYAPFDDSNTQVLLYKAQNELFEIPKFLSSECRDVIRSMLVANPEKRATMIDLYNHPWLAGEFTQEELDDVANDLENGGGSFSVDDESELSSSMYSMSHSNSRGSSTDLNPISEEGDHNDHAHGRNKASKGKAAKHGGGKTIDEQVDEALAMDEAMEAQKRRAQRRRQQELEEQEHEREQGQGQQTTTLTGRDRTVSQDEEDDEEEEGGVDMYHHPSSVPIGAELPDMRLSSRSNSRSSSRQGSRGPSRPSSRSSSRQGSRRMSVNEELELYNRRRRRRGSSVSSVDSLPQLSSSVDSSSGMDAYDEMRSGSTGSGFHRMRSGSGGRAQIRYSNSPPVQRGIVRVNSRESSVSTDSHSSFMSTSSGASSSSYGLGNMGNVNRFYMSQMGVRDSPGRYRGLTPLSGDKVRSMSVLVEEETEQSSLETLVDLDGGSTVSSYASSGSVGTASTSSSGMGVGPSRRQRTSSRLAEVQNERTPTPPKASRVSPSVQHSTGRLSRALESRFGAQLDVALEAGGSSDRSSTELGALAERINDHEEDGQQGNRESRNMRSAGTGADEEEEEEISPKVEHGEVEDRFWSEDNFIDSKRANTTRAQSAMRGGNGLRVSRRTHSNGLRSRSSLSKTLQDLENGNGG